MTRNTEEESFIYTLGSDVVHVEDCPHLKARTTTYRVDSVEAHRRPCSTCMVARDHPYVEEFYDQ